MSIARNHAVDTIKGLLIIFVVVGHSGVVLPKADFFGKIFIDNFGELTEYNFFHMPAFFVIGGLYVKQFKSEIKSLFPLAICYIFWTILTFKHHIIDVPEALLISNWESLHSILWFIPAFLTFKIIHLVIKYFYYSKYLFLLSGLIVVFFSSTIQTYHAEIPWGIDIAIYLLPISLIVNYIYYNELFMYTRIHNIITNHSNIIILALFIVFTVLAMVVKTRVPINTFTKFHLRLDLAQFTVPGLEGFLYLLLMMLCMTVFFKCEINENILSTIEKKTLPIYVFHYPILKLIGKIFQSSPLFSWFFSISLTILACIVASTVLLRINKKFRYIGA